MKKKSFLLICTMSFFVLIIALMSSNLFYVKNILIQGDLVYPENITALIHSEITKNIFLVNKQKIKYIIQTNYPSINVDYSECFFPDKIIIKLSLRQSLYALEGEDGFYILDHDMNIIKKEQAFSSTPDNPIILYGDKIKNGITGMSADTNKQDYISLLSYSLNEWKTPDEVKSEICSIHLDYTKDNNLLLSFFSGVNIMIENSDKNLITKLSSALIYYQTQNVKTGTIKIIDTDQNTLLIYDNN